MRKEQISERVSLATKFLSAKQQELYQKLFFIDEKAADAYIGALNVLNSLENPDRFAQFAHSLREVTNLISRKVNIPQQTKEFVESLGKKNSALKKKLEEQFIEEPDFLPLPSKQRIELLMKKWVNLHNFFTSISHHGRELNEKDLLAVLSEFEAILLHFIKDEPITIEQLDHLLSIENPTEDDVNKLKELLIHPEHVKYFFSKLESPNWLGLLEKHGFFAKTPQIVRRQSYILFPIWPLSKYLIKIANRKPREVMDIIKTVREKENFRIWNDFVQCSLMMPASIAKDIVPLAKEWAKSPYLSPIQEKIGQLCIKLCYEQETASSLRLLESLLDVKTGFKEKGIFLKESNSYYDIWTYKKILEDVIPVLIKKEPLRILQILCDRLLRAIELEIPDRKVYRDHSYIWRPAIEDRERNDIDVKNLLVTAIKDNLENLGKVNVVTFEKCYKLLSNYNSAVFRRIEFHLMRLFPEVLKNEIEKVLSKREFFDDINVWHEYYHLLKERFSQLPQTLKENILHWIYEGPDLAKYESAYKKEIGREPTNEEKEAYKAHWQIRYLSAIEEALPPERKRIWDVLMQKYGKPNHPDYSFYGEAKFIGPESPLGIDEIRKMSPQEIINYFMNWEPPKDLFGPSREGLAILFKELLEEELSGFIDICNQFNKLHPVYIFYFFEGLRNAIKKGKKFNWIPIVSLCKDILKLSEICEVPDDKDRLYDWESIKGVIADLLREGLDSQISSPPFELRSEIFEILALLLRDDKDREDYEIKDKEESFDLFTLSFNTFFGKAVHALLNYALWSNKLLNSNNKKNIIPSEVKRKLKGMLNPEYKNARMVRSVLGGNLPLLFYLDKNWTLKNISIIFHQDAETLWISAWQAYIIWAQIDIHIYKAMRTHYKRAINKMNSPKISKKANEGLVKHLMVAYLREIEDHKNNSLINLFFKRANGEMRGYALWFIGMKLEELPKMGLSREEEGKIARRAMTLFEWRLNDAHKTDPKTKEELKNFGTWFISNHLDKAWAISRLVKTLELTDGAIKPEYDVIVELEKYLDQYYMEVLKILSLLAKGDREGWVLMSAKKKIEEYLNSIIARHSHQEIKTSMNNLVNILIRKGHYEFKRYFIK